LSDMTAYNEVTVTTQNLSKKSQKYQPAWKQNIKTKMLTWYLMKKNIVQRISCVRILCQANMNFGVKS
jgi:hypothetical protein